MIELVYSNETERLLEELVAYLRKARAAGAHPLDPVELVVPNRNMETWVSLGMAERLGVAANLRFRRLERFVGELVSEAFGGELQLVDLDAIEAALLSILLDDEELQTPELEPVRRYLQSAGIADTGAATSFDAHLSDDGADLRRVQLASRLAHLFQEYAYARPEMISAWRDYRGDGGGKERAPGDALGRLPFSHPEASDPSLGPTVRWQRALFRRVFAKGGALDRAPPASGGRWMTLDRLALDEELFSRLKEVGLPTVHVFGVSYVARLFQILFARLGEVGTLRIYTLNPCAEYWEDVETDRELFRRLDKDVHSRSRRVWAGTGETDEQDPFGFAEADTPALKYWGRPGREHIRLLGELTECDFKSAFSDPVRNTEREPGLLHVLQRDILHREPERVLGAHGPPGSEADLGRRGGKEETETASPDHTLRLVAAPSVRREVEWVADEIWRLLREDEPRPGCPPLRFSDIAVIVNSAERDVYLPEIEAVFSACHDLPSSVSDLPGAAGSRFIEAMSLLLELPFGRFSRAEMLAFMGHPAVMGRFDDLSPDDLAERAESLGIVFGADASDHAGTYIDEDVYNWDQGIRRLALGAFMTGEKSGDERIFEAGGQRWLVEEAVGSSTSAAARFGLMARSLIADARFVRGRRMRPSEWARFYAAQIDAYLHVESGADARDRLRCLRALARLEGMDQGLEVSGKVAAEIASRAVESLGGGRGQYLAEGVVVSSFLPMRAIPFQAVFVLGLGEGLFPASGRRDALDLRSARRRAGDVDPSERDRYMFLETLLCARSRLYLSYVRRDEQTGDPLQPSAVVQELVHMLARGYVGEEGVEALRVEPPLRRFDEPRAATSTFLDEARVEARARQLGSSLRSRMPSSEASGDDEVRRSMDHRAAADVGALRSVVREDALEKLSSMLALPGDPPATSSIRATARPLDASKEEGIEAPVMLSLTALRRFLECPMQGWASRMLGLSEDDDDLADREEEDFEVGMLLETGLLREAFLDAAARRTSPSTVYDERAARLRLAGRMPVGVLGRVIASRHGGVLEGWSSLLEEVLGGGGEDGSSGCVPVPLHRVRLGRSGRECASEVVVDPLVLDVDVVEESGRRVRVPVRVTGRTEGLVDDRSTTVVLQPRKAPVRLYDSHRGRFFRYLLRAVVDHAVLSATGAAGEGERSLILALSVGPADTRAFGLRLSPMTSERARVWLSHIAADLFGGHHDYLLPCEAVFLEHYHRTMSKKKEANGKAEGDASAQLAGDIDGAKLQKLASDMAEDDRRSFSSTWGPVPAPRSYAPPAPDEAARIATRRFGPLFEDIIEVEGL